MAKTKFQITITHPSGRVELLNLASEKLMKVAKKQAEEMGCTVRMGDKR